jgi:hypothetical protein
VTQNIAQKVICSRLLGGEMTPETEIGLGGAGGAGGANRIIEYYGPGLATLTAGESGDKKPHRTPDTVI